ncbi:MAG: tRNA pseudouridine(55) synthase TruB [Caldimicrobium sp.]
MNKVERVYLSGILVLDKPKGISSTEAMEKVKKLLRIKKIGHGGTLDPISTGVLPLFLNEATKIAQVFLEGDKVYEGTFQLGLVTDTYDLTGEVLERFEPRDIDLEKLKKAAQSLVGDIEQIPPPYSAIKFKGRPLYKYARDGLLIPAEPRKIKIYQFEIRSLENNIASFYIKCSKGTYVRSLIHHLGKILECGAVLLSLRRLQKSIFTLEEALTLDEIEKIAKTAPEKIKEYIISIPKALEFLPKVIVSEEFAHKVRLGKLINKNSFLSLIKFQKLSLSPSEKWIRIVDIKGDLVALIHNPLLHGDSPYLSYLRVFKSAI